VALDEAAKLRSYGSKTFQEFLPMFESVEFKFVFTASEPEQAERADPLRGLLGRDGYRSKFDKIFPAR
jgi:hypothetical protein